MLSMFEDTIRKSAASNYTFEKVSPIRLGFPSRLADPSQPYSNSFYAMITGASDIGDTFFDWVAVPPAMSTMAVAQPSTLIASFNLWTFQQPYVAGMGNAREENDSRDIPAGTVVLLTFVGYAVAPDSGDGVLSGTITTEGGTTGEVAGSDNSVPFYVFQYTTQSSLGVLPIHDHRDNITGGGFAFSVYHPGLGQLRKGHHHRLRRQREMPLQ